VLTLPPEYLALRRVEVLASLAILIGTAELLVTRAHWGDRGTWRWSNLAEELGPARWVLATKPFGVLLVVRLLAAAWLLWEPSTTAIAVAWVSSLLVNVRFRGPYNGGSDHMLTIVQSAVLIGRVGEAHAIVVQGAMVWVGVQALFSYTVAGIAKLRHASWRDGRALPGLLAIPAYGVPVGVRALLQRPGVARVAAWGVLAFECGFPLVLLGPHVARAGVGLALAFHLANAWVLGLNRFLFTWAATWPALLYVAERTGGA
jgi:hypothetical protein